jgi:hypothetical protein
MMRTSELELVQFGRFTISWITAARLAVRCSNPTSPTLSHGPGVHVTSASVRGLGTILFVPENVGGLSAAWPSTVSEVGFAHG